MNYKLLFTATVCAAVFCAAPVHADYTSWQDPSYDFSKISRIYVGRVDMSDVALSSARQKSLEMTFASRMNKAKISKDVMLTIEAPTASTSRSVSRVQKTSAESGTEEADDLFEAAKAANAQVYILPRLTRWQVKSYIEPAHVEWKSVQVRDSYQDKDGNWHDFYRTETYPDYVPAQEIPYAVVTMTFEWYDALSGELIASSEDDRTRNAENDPKGMYQRIVDRFAKDLKEKVTSD